MTTVDLGKTGKRTTRLGYGCSSLMGAMGRRESLAMLEAAFDAGIRHFDVAPMYGMGQAEGCVGEFLARHRHEVTVATKYGIPAPKRQRLIGIGRQLARPLLKTLPWFKGGLIKAASKVATPSGRASFTGAEAEASLHSSLIKLRTDHIDLWLLHEVEADQLNDDGLLRVLENAVASGKIGAFGIGSERAKVEMLIGSRPEYCPVLQFEWSVIHPAFPGGHQFRIHHSSIASSFRTLRDKMRTDPLLCARWSAEIGQDMRDAVALASLMLKAALVENPMSVILVSSKDRNHIQHNAVVAGNHALEFPAHLLYQTVQREIVGKAPQEVVP